MMNYDDVMQIRSGACQSAGRSVHQRTATSESHPAENCGTGGGRSAALRHLAAVARITRLRIENPQPLPGDRKHPRRSAGRHQTQAEHQPGDSQEDPAVPHR